MYFTAVFFKFRVEKLARMAAAGNPSGKFCLSSMQQFSLQNARLALVQRHSRTEHARVLAVARERHLACELRNLTTIVHQKLLNEGFFKLTCVCS